MLTPINDEGLLAVLILEDHHFVLVVEVYAPLITRELDAHQLARFRSYFLPGHLLEQVEVLAVQLDGLDLIEN